MALFLTQRNGMTPSTSRSNTDRRMDGVADSGKTSERARSGTLVMLPPCVSAVETGVWFLTASIPEADPEKLRRILTGVAPRLGTELDIVPLKVIRPVAASFVMAVRHGPSYSGAERTVVIALSAGRSAVFTSTCSS